MYDGATKVFGGRIYAVTTSDAGHGKKFHSVQAKDYSYDLGRLLVVEEYDGMTVEDVITAILTAYAPDFTHSNVVCTLNVVKVVFDRITVMQAIQKLADMAGFSWYVDYDKDIHFFEKNTEPAPFTIEDDNGNLIAETLEITDDLSQIRNRIFIKGGEVEGDERTEPINGDGTKKQFKLSNKFSHIPTVMVGGVPKTVGVDYIDDEASFDCFWDYNQQYIRFKDTTIPGVGANNILVTGLPLYRLVVQVSDPTSITANGIFEYTETDETLKSRESAVAFARAQIAAYKDGVTEGHFETYTPGLRSGQIIEISTSLRGVTEYFLIQRTSFSMLTQTSFVWSVELATLKTVGLIDFLMSLLQNGTKLLQDTGEVVLEKTEFPEESLGITETVDVNTEDIPIAESAEIQEAVVVQALDYGVQFVLGPCIPHGTKRVFCLDGSRMI
jgi:hypothetical protein